MDITIYEGGMKLTGSKLLTKNFVIIFMANFLISLIFLLLMTTLTLYAINQFNASPSKAGLASSIFVIGALISRLFAGKYIEVIGRKKTLYGSLLLFFIASLLYFSAYQLSLLLVVRFIHGATFGIVTTAMQTIAIAIIPNGRHGEGISIFSLSSTLGMAFGPFLGSYLAAHFDFNKIFVVCAIFSLISIIIVLFAKIPEANITIEQMNKMKKGFKWNNFFEVHAIPISIIIFVMGVAYSGIITYINAYSIEVNLTKPAGFFFIVYALFLLISRPFTGKLFDKKGDNIVMYPAFILFSISLVLLSTVNHGFTLLAVGVLLALGLGTLMSCAQAIAIKEAPRHQIGLATATFYMCVDGGLGIGPLLIGMLIQIFGFRDMYMILAIIVLLSIFPYYLVNGKKAATRNQKMNLHL